MIDLDLTILKGAIELLGSLLKNKNMKTTWSTWKYSLNVTICFFSLPEDELSGQFNLVKNSQWRVCIFVLETALKNSPFRLFENHSCLTVPVWNMPTKTHTLCSHCISFRHFGAGKRLHSSARSRRSGFSVLGPQSSAPCVFNKTMTEGLLCCVVAVERRQFFELMRPPMTVFLLDNCIFNRLIMLMDALVRFK